MPRPGTLCPAVRLAERWETRLLTSASYSPTNALEYLPHLLYQDAEMWTLSIPERIDAQVVPNCPCSCRHDLNPGILVYRHHRRTVAGFVPCPLPVFYWLFFTKPKGSLVLSGLPLRRTTTLRTSQGCTEDAEPLQ